MGQVLGYFAIIWSHRRAPAQGYASVSYGVAATPPPYLILCNRRRTHLRGPLHFEPPAYHTAFLARLFRTRALSLADTRNLSNHKSLCTSRREKQNGSASADVYIVTARSCSELYSLAGLETARQAMASSQRLLRASSVHDSIRLVSFRLTTLH